jgi:hypothetical protein
MNTNTNTETNTKTVVRREIPAKIKSYLSFGMWLLSKSMNDEEVMNKMKEIFKLEDKIEVICEKFEEFNEKEMTEKLSMIRKALTAKSKIIASPGNIVADLVNLANGNVQGINDEKNKDSIQVSNEVKEADAPASTPKKKRAPKKTVTPVVDASAPVVEQIADAPVPTDASKKKRAPKKNVTPVVDTTAPVVEQVTEQVIVTDASASAPITDASASAPIVDAPKKKRASKKAVVEVPVPVPAPIIVDTPAPSNFENERIELAIAHGEAGKEEEKKKRAPKKAKITESKNECSNVVKPVEKPIEEKPIEKPVEEMQKPSDEEFEDKELVVKEFVYENKEFYIDEEQVIYEKEGLSQVGKLVNGKLIFTNN